MKVFVISGKHPLQSPGGYATYAYSLCKCLKKLDCDVHIIAFSSKPGVEESPIGTIHKVVPLRARARIPRIKTLFLRTESFPLWSLIFSRYISRLIKQEKISKCIVHGIGPWGLTGVFLKRKHKNNVKLVSSYFTTVVNEVYWLMRGIRVEDYGVSVKLRYVLAYLFALFFLGPFEKLFLDENDAILVHYASTKDMLTKEYGVNSGRIMKIPYYVEIYNKGGPRAPNPEKRNRLEDAIKRRPLCVTVCRQEPRKGINYLIRAVKVIRDSGHAINMVVVGSGSLLERNKELARKLGIEDSILFTGFVADVRPFLQNADLFVFPSLQEGSGALSVLDAMKMGAPIVSTACDGICEDIEDRVTGLLVPPMNEYLLAKRIIELINDKKLATELGRNAANEWQRKFDAKKMTEGIRDCYRAIDRI